MKPSGIMVCVLPSHFQSNSVIGITSGPREFYHLVHIYRDTHIGNVAVKENEKGKF